MRAANKARVAMQAADTGEEAPAATRPARFTRPSFYAATVDQLRAAFPGQEDAAERVAEDGAISLWFMDVDRSANEDGRFDAHQLVRLAHLAANGWEPPLWTGTPPRPRLADLSPDARADAERMAAETRAEWRAATGGVLPPDRITRTHKYLVGCLAAAEAASPADLATPKEPA